MSSAFDQDIDALRIQSDKRENFVECLSQWKARTNFEKKLVLGIMHRKGHRNFEEQEENEKQLRLDLNKPENDDDAEIASSFYSALSSRRPVTNQESKSAFSTHQRHTSQKSARLDINQHKNISIQLYEQDKNRLSFEDKSTLKIPTAQHSHRSKHVTIETLNDDRHTQQENFSSLRSSPRQTLH